jgi:porphyrinogen peroxidase
MRGSLPANARIARAQGALVRSLGMSVPQRGIALPLPPSARYLTFRVGDRARVRHALSVLAAMTPDDGLVVGLGASLIGMLGADVPGVREFPILDGARVAIPSTPASLWCWLRGDDRGALLLRGRELARSIAPGFELEDEVDGFRHGSGRDLTGYEDGTENPKGDAVAEVTFAGGAQGLAGSSFVAVQRWHHDLDRFSQLEPAAQDRAIGRRRSDNVELPDAPPAAHVKRTAQESFEPEAFVLRRSMPWSDGRGHGLVFVAFGRSFDAFDAQLRRMAGIDDGIVDALFDFTRPATGGYFWCPPVADGRLDLRVLGL